MTEKAHLPPGTVVHVGEPSEADSVLSAVVFDGKRLTVRDAVQPSEAPNLIGEGDKTWLRFVGIHDVNAVKAIGQALDIHPLALEDIVNTVQRPKVEDFGDYLFITLKSPSMDSEGIRLRHYHISLVVWDNCLISFEESARPQFDMLMERARARPGRFTSQGAGYLMALLLDSVVDSYFSIIEMFSELMRAGEEEVFEDPTKRTLQYLFRMKRVDLDLRRTVLPMREVVVVIQRDAGELLDESVKPYLRDVHDHLSHVLEASEMLRETLDGLLDIYHSSVGTRLNEVMKVLTIVATIFIPLTLISGIYGMNFKYMPELEWKWGYPAVLIGMVVLSIGMAVFFRFRRWM
jgi:magnesium transporter